MHSLVKTLVIAVVALGVCIAVPEGAQARLCVAYALALSDINVRGNAWAWWDNAAGQYDRGHQPAVGSVLVFKRSPHLRLGHVSVVSAVVDRRTILVDHSWTGDQLHRGVRVIDTSPNNDWSSVRVWNPRHNMLGQTNYATYGFIYSPSRHGHPRPPETVVAAAAPVPHREQARPMPAFDPEDVPLPERKPGVADTLVADAMPIDPAEVPLPARRPGSDMILTAAAESEVERRVAGPGAVPVPQPPRRPDTGRVEVAASVPEPSQARPEGLEAVPLPGRRPGETAAAPPVEMAALHDFVMERRKPASPDGPPQVASRFDPGAF